MLIRGPYFALVKSWAYLYQGGVAYTTGGLMRGEIRNFRRKCNQISPGLICRKIWYLKTPQLPEDWKDLSKGFEEIMSFPRIGHCIPFLVASVALVIQNREGSNSLQKFIFFKN